MEGPIEEVAKTEAQAAENLIRELGIQVRFLILVIFLCATSFLYLELEDSFVAKTCICRFICILFFSSHIFMLDVAGSFLSSALSSWYIL